MKAQGSNEETNGGGYSCDVFSLDEILQGPENVCKNEEQNAIDDKFTIAELSGYPRQDDGYVGENGSVNWIDPSNGDNTNWPLRAYSTQNHVNGTLSADGFFDTVNGTNSYSGPSDNQNLYLQDDGLTSSHQVGDNMPFYDASSNHKWVDGKDDYLNLNDLLYPPAENQPLFDAGDDLMAYFDATEDDFKFDIMGTEDSNSQLPDMSNFVQKVCFGARMSHNYATVLLHLVRRTLPDHYPSLTSFWLSTVVLFSLQDDNNNKFTLDGISNTALYGASSSGSHGNMYPDTAVPGMALSLYAY